MTSRTEPRVDVYGPVHKGLRFAMCSLLSRMAQHEPAEDHALPMLCDDLEGVLYLCACHAGHEERHLHTALEVRRPGAAGELQADHVQLEQQVVRLRELSAQLMAADAPSRPGTFRELYLRYSAFVGHNLQHMADEELRGLPLLETLYTTQELSVIHAELVRGLGPDERLSFLRAMLGGVGPSQRRALLESAHAQLPRDDWQSLAGHSAAGTNGNS